MTSKGQTFAPTMKTRVQHHTSIRTGRETPPRKLGIQEAFLTQVLFLSLCLGLGCTVSQSPKGLLNAKLVCLSTSVPAAKRRNQTW